jgi:allene oxide cyclase
MKRGWLVGIVVVLIAGLLMTRGAAPDAGAQETPGAETPLVVETIVAETEVPETVEADTPAVETTVGETPAGDEPGAEFTGTVIRVVEHAETDTPLDLGEEGDSIGDLIAFGNPIFDEANEEQIGTNQGQCVRTVLGQSYECFWTIILADGQITVQGPFNDAADSVMAITGGTGAYAGARGQMRLHARDDEGTEYDLTYELLD